MKRTMRASKSTGGARARPAESASKAGCDILEPGHAERRLSIREIVALRPKLLKWSCWIRGCDHRFRFRLDELEAAPFLVIRHLIRDHGMTPAEVIETEPILAQEVRDYCRSMGLDTPVAGCTGVSAEMDTRR